MFTSFLQYFNPYIIRDGRGIVKGEKCGAVLAAADVWDYNRTDKNRKGGAFMFCNKCGYKLGEGDNFCPKCGAKRTVLEDSAGEVPQKSEKEKIKLPEIKKPEISLPKIKLNKKMF